MRDFAMLIVEINKYLDNHNDEKEDIWQKYKIDKYLLCCVDFSKMPAYN